MADAEQVVPMMTPDTPDTPSAPSRQTVRLECPICDWSLKQPPLYRSGALPELHLRAHVEDHDPEEWMREIARLQSALTEAQKALKRISERYPESVGPEGWHTCREVDHQDRCAGCIARHALEQMKEGQ